MSKAGHGSTQLKLRAQLIVSIQVSSIDRGHPETTFLLLFICVSHRSMNMVFNLSQFLCFNEGGCDGLTRDDTIFLPFSLAEGMFR